MGYLIAYDLGTGGVKASLHDEAGRTLFTAFLSYPTTYSGVRHEQRPEDWWNAVCRCTRELLERSGADPHEILCTALSGHSLVAAPIGAGGELLMDSVPIWSDTRAGEQTRRFFQKVDYDRWYRTTGNGDPAECYSAMKLMWLREQEPDIYGHTAAVLGSKDYINFRLTGKLATDYSYASGSGVFNLKKLRYEPRFIEATGLKRELFLDPIPSYAPVGEVTREAAAATGLAAGTKVACGGVDNACMALGACGTGEGRSYTSLGSCCWIAVTSRAPIVDAGFHPFVFSLGEAGWYTSAVSIFSGGTSLEWVRKTLCGELEGPDAFRRMDELAEQVPPGSRGVLFNPSLGGGSSQERSPNIRGAFLGLSLDTTRAQLVRATLEGVAMNLRLLLDMLSARADLSDEMLLVGGGSKSGVWRQIFADVYGRTVRKTQIDQNAASLGAAAMAARSCGLWSDYSQLDRLHGAEELCRPRPEVQAVYERLLGKFRRANEFLAEFGDPGAGLA